MKPRPRRQASRTPRFDATCRPAFDRKRALQQLSAIILNITMTNFFNRIIRTIRKRAGKSGHSRAAARSAVCLLRRWWRSRSSRCVHPRAVNQLIYGNRDQPEVILRELVATLDRDIGAEDPFAALAETLARSLRFSAVVLDVDGGSDLRASYASDQTRVTGVVRGGGAVAPCASARGDDERGELGQIAVASSTLQPPPLRIMVSTTRSWSTFSPLMLALRRYWFR